MLLIDPMEKCVKCGKVRVDHKYPTLHCPTGRKSRTLGYLSFSSTARFRSKAKGKVQGVFRSFY